MSQLTPICLEDLTAGRPFIYTGPFVNLQSHPLKHKPKSAEPLPVEDQVRPLMYDARTASLMDIKQPHLFWDVDRFGGDLVDGEKYKAQTPAQRLQGHWTSPGFRVFNHRHGFIGILFTECKTTEGTNV